MPQGADALPSTRHVVPQPHGFPSDLFITPPGSLVCHQHRSHSLLTSSGREAGGATWCSCDDQELLRRRLCVLLCIPGLLEEVLQVSMGRTLPHAADGCTPLSGLVRAGT